MGKNEKNEKLPRRGSFSFFLYFPNFPHHFPHFPHGAVFHFSYIFPISSPLSPSVPHFPHHFPHFPQGAVFHFFFIFSPFSPLSPSFPHVEYGESLVRLPTLRVFHTYFFLIFPTFPIISPTSIEENPNFMGQFYILLNFPQLEYVSSFHDFVKSSPLSPLFHFFHNLNWGKCIMFFNVCVYALSVV